MNINKDDIVTREINDSEIGIAAIALAEIFLENPVYGSIFPHEENRLAGLTWLFERNLRFFKKKKCTQILVSNTTGEIKTKAQIIGLYSMVPPDGWGVNAFDYIKNGILTMPFLFGMQSVRRMLYSLRANDSEIESVISAHNYWYLGLVAVSPDYRNQGIATFMLTSCLNKICSEAAAKPTVVLTTQLPSNVRLYERIGFKVIKDAMIGFKKKNIRNYVMVRE